MARVTACPHCHSTNIQYMTQDRKTFNKGIGCLGLIIAWPLALLGFVGKAGKHNWHCNNCGHNFKTK